VRLSLPLFLCVYVLCLYVRCFFVSLSDLPISALILLHSSNYCPSIVDSALLELCKMMLPTSFSTPITLYH